MFLVPFRTFRPGMFSPMCNRFRHACNRSWCLVPLVLLLGGGGLAACLGCITYPPNRISLDEFLELVEEEERLMQREREALTNTPPTTTAPAISNGVVPATIVDEQLQPYRVGPGDIIGVRVTLLDQLELGTSPIPVQVRVDRNGDIELPLVGTLHVEGLEVEDIENEVERAYVPRVYKDAIVGVSLIEVKYTQVIMRGAVGTPGLIRLRRTERNLLYAMNTAGGMAPTASGRVTVVRIRRPAESQTFNISDPVELRAALCMSPLEEGDIVTAEAAQRNVIYMYGAWGRTQAFPDAYRPRVMELIALNSGVTKELAIEEATLIRQMRNGKMAWVQLNIPRLARGEDPNFELKSGDIIWTNWTLALLAQDWLNKNVVFRLAGSASFSYQAQSEDTLNGIHTSNDQATQGTGTTLEDQFDPFGFLFPPAPIP